jgi:cyclomaltodextrinase / maltogenic alpha-amylase / neopullulanase
MISKNSTLYQIVTDRFDNSEGNLHKCIAEPEYNSRFGKEYLGGNFEGIRRRMDYIENLGVNHVLISPVQESPFYHGYHISNHFEVNPRFGSKDELKKLIEEFHRRNIKVMLDYASTHLHSSNPIFREKVRSDSERDRDWFVFSDKLRTKSPYRFYFEELIYKLTSGDHKKLKEINKSEYLGFFGDPNNPLLNLENPDVQEFHRKVLYYWIREFGFDSVRMDSAFIQPKDFIKKMRSYLKTTFKDFDLITEYWDFENPTRSGDCYGFCDGEFDIRATLWFNRMSEDFHNFFKNVSGHYYRSKDHMEDYSYIVSLANHDLPRFNERKNLQKIAAVLQFTLPSIPLVYYGEEIGMKQDNDKRDRLDQSRDPMRWDLEDVELFHFYKKLIEFRKKHSFNKFSISNVQVNDEGTLFTYGVTIGNESHCILLNTENRPKPVDLELMFQGSIIDPFDIISDMPVTFENERVLNMHPESCYLFKEIEKTDLVKN